jgi:hypothetical protein
MTAPASEAAPVHFTAMPALKEILRPMAPC